MSLAFLDKVIPNKWLRFALLIAIALTCWAFIQPKNTTDEKSDLFDESKLKQIESVKSNMNPVLLSNALNNDVVSPIKKRVNVEKNSYDPFSANQLYEVVPIKKIKSGPAPVPTAPPAPFIYLGKYESIDSNTQIFLLENGKLYTALQGENINQLWRLEGEDTNNIKLTYLPLNLPQQLSKIAKQQFLKNVNDVSETN